jgi:hypothetical protein
MITCNIPRLWVVMIGIAFFVAWSLACYIAGINTVLKDTVGGLDELRRYHVQKMQKANEQGRVGRIQDQRLSGLQE